MLQKRCGVLFFVFILAFSSKVFAQSSDNDDTLTMCIDHYPPLQMVLPNGKATGENVEVARNFFAQLGLKLKFTSDTPFKRCLQWLKDGLVDVMVGLLDSEQRQLDYHMYLYDDVTVKSFFVRKNYITLRRFEDLRDLSVAVVRGSRQFRQFDQAPEDMFTRVYVGNLSAAFGMLEKGRVDAVVCTDYYGENVMKSHPDYMQSIVKAEYSVVDGTKNYIAVSRKSVFSKYHNELQSLAEKMHATGAFKEQVSMFQSNHPELY